jgi:acetate kinase
MTETILVLNSGSSSIKFQLFALSGPNRLERRIKGQIEHTYALSSAGIVN